jgi:hypothetical protein
VLVNTTYTGQGDVKEGAAHTTGDRAGRLRDHLLDHLNATHIPAIHGSCSEIYRKHFFGRMASRRGMKAAGRWMTKVAFPTQERSARRRSLS